MEAKKLLVIIDLGHGGTDPGATGNGVVEKTANYNTGMSLKKYLESIGVKVLLTRTGDNTVSLSQRTTLANNWAKQYPGHTVIFVSVHHNAGGGDRGEYIYSIYGGAGKDIAESIGNEMNKQLGQQKKCYTKKGTNNADYYHVIRNTIMPAVIVEVAFLDNKTDVQICDTVEEQQRNGRVIGDGILRWAKISKPAISTPKPPTNNSTSSSSEMYRVRKSWGDVASQKGAFKDKNNAIAECKKHSSYSVFDSKGNSVFTNSTNTFKVGSKVKVIGSKYATGQTIPTWVKSNTYSIKELKSDKALLSDIISWVYLKDLKLV